MEAESAERRGHRADAGAPRRASSRLRARSSCGCRPASIWRSRPVSSSRASCRWRPVARSARSGVLAGVEPGRRRARDLRRPRRRRSRLDASLRARAGRDRRFTGPFGSFKLAEPPPAPLVFVGEGTGIAPLRPMVRRALERRGDRTDRRCCRARATTTSCCSTRELEAWAPPMLASTGSPCCSRPRPRSGRSRRSRSSCSSASSAATPSAIRRFWICGVGAMAGRLRDALRAAGYERRAVRAEQW